MRKAPCCLLALLLVALLLPALALAEKPDPPTLNTPAIGDTQLSGTCVPGAEVKILLSGAVQDGFSTTNSAQGVWRVDMPDPLPANTQIRVIQTVSGEASSPLIFDLTAAPHPPTNLQATPGNRMITLTWDAPAYTGDSLIEAYEVAYGDKSNNPTLIRFTTTDTTAVIHYPHGIRCDIEVRAINQNGEKSAPASTISTADTVPNQISLGTAIVDSEMVVLTWGPASSSGSPITKLIISEANGKIDNIEVAPDEKSHPVHPLTNGEEYIFQIHAVNAMGPGPVSTWDAVRPNKAPNPPQAVDATPGNQSVTLTWQAPAVGPGDGTVDGYWVSVDSATWIDVGNTLSYTFPNLKNGVEYRLGVQAYNNVDFSDGVFTTVTPAANPGLPQNVQATPGDQSATLTWEAPTDTGGLPVLGYRVSGDGALWQDLPASADSHTFTGLTNGTAYTLYVKAYTAASESGIATAKVTPLGDPAQPQNVTATPGVESATLQWSAPTDTGGSPLLGYRVSEGGALWQDLPASADTHTFTGLTSGQPYTLYVKAFTAISESPAATAQATPLAGSDDILLTIDPVYEYDPYITGTCEAGSQIYLVFGGSARQIAPYRTLGAGSLAPLPGTPATVTGTRWSYDVSGLSLRAGDPVTVIQTVGGVTKNILRATVATRSGTLPPVIVNPPAPGDTSLSGTAIPGATVTVTGPDGTPIGSAQADPDGNWTYPLPAPIQPDDVYLVTQTVGPNTSAPIPAAPSSSGKAATKEFEAPPSGYGIIIGSRVNARERPSLDATVLTQLSQGTRVRIVDWGMAGDDGSGPWCKITVGDQMYFVHNDYVDGTAPF